jgi:hypothetical protein
MRIHLLVFIFLWAGYGVAQVTETKAAPQVKSMTIEEGAVTTVYLSPGYATSIRLPEEIRSVVVGNPANFKAEHSDSEPRLVFLKPITTKPTESNALITTRSGQEISLHLISSGQGATQPRVDFLLEYRRPGSMLINSNAGQSFFVSETKPISSGGPPDVPHRGEKPDPIAEMLVRQKAVAAPRWEGNTLQVSVGASIERDHQTFLGFSILNNSNRTIELQLPQIELSGKAGNGKGKQIKAEPIVIAECRMTTRRLERGERADGVAVFERPSFKESSEKLELQVAESGQVDHPISVPIPFVATSIGGAQ